MKTVKTRPLFAAHEKCIKILETIHETACRYSVATTMLYTYDNSQDPFHPVKLFNTREKLVERRAHWRTVHVRLVQYYVATLGQLIPGVEQSIMPALTTPNC